MAQDNQFSPLFGHVQESSDPPVDWLSVSELPDKKNTLLDTLSPRPETPYSQPVPSSVSVNTLHSADSSGPVLAVLETPSAPSDLSVNNSMKTTEPSENSVSVHSEIPDETLSSSIIPPENIDTMEVDTPSTKTPQEPESKLAQYLQADRVYQEMMRVERSEKIRLQLAIRYTLLMFAIFIVFAWIVSNRIIMFGFSEFVWLARIRDVLFGVMSGLFGLTLWFGSVSWSHNTIFIAVIRVLAVVFFCGVIIALYIPL